MESDAKEGLAGRSGSACWFLCGFCLASMLQNLAHGRQLWVALVSTIGWLVLAIWSSRRSHESPNSGMNDSQSHQPSMTSEQLDRFQDWLNREAVEANNKSGAYFNGRACAFNDAFECLAILRMKASQTPESTETDKSQSAS